MVRASPSVYRAAPQRTNTRRACFWLLYFPPLVSQNTRCAIIQPIFGKDAGCTLTSKNGRVWAGCGEGSRRLLFGLLAALIWFENQPPPASPAVCPPHDAVAIPRLASGGSTSQPEATCLCSTLPLLKDQYITKKLNRKVLCVQVFSAAVGNKAAGIFCTQKDPTLFLPPPRRQPRK